MKLQKNFATKLVEYYSNIYLDMGFRQSKTDFIEFVSSSINNGWTSPSWNTGGNWRNCWGDDHTIEAEDPKDFTQEFKDFIKEYYPGLNIRRDDFDDICTTVDDSEADWYGGVAYTSYKSLSPENLQNLLIEKCLETKEEVDEITETKELKNNSKTSPTLLQAIIEEKANDLEEVFEYRDTKRARDELNRPQKYKV